ncbi:hypothetical protein [Bradyrhizobium oligotrophicum]|uniref:hypothetical protein n=1 Tax=Bradyrhizobium oligotrophicum TaxID=44255 RepID=UPI003EBEE97A
MLSWRPSKWSAALFIGPVMVCATAAAADAPQSRLVAEATRLFAVVLADDPSPERCELASDWDSSPVPEEIAHRDLGLRLHASLSAPESFTGPAKVLSPRGGGAICRDSEANDLEAQRLAAFEGGTDKNIFVKRRAYTFPVFDEGYHTAVFVVTYERFGWYRKPAGIARLAPEAAVTAVVYRKAGGRWRRVTMVELGST